MVSEPLSYFGGNEEDCGRLVSKIKTVKTVRSEKRSSGHCSVCCRKLDADVLDPCTASAEDEVLTDVLAILCRVSEY